MGNAWFGCNLREWQWIPSIVVAVFINKSQEKTKLTKINKSGYSSDRLDMVGSGWSGYHVRWCYFFALQKLCIFAETPKPFDVCICAKLMVMMSFSAYICRNSKISKLSQNVNNSVYICRNSKWLSCASMRKTVLAVWKFSLYVRRNSKIR